RPFLERKVEVKALVTRTFPGSVLATFNWGLSRRTAPFTRNATLVAFGARWPENATVTVGFSWRRVALERESRFRPELRLLLPHDMPLRLGGVTGTHHRPDRFIARAILETEL